MGGYHLSIGLWLLEEYPLINKPYGLLIWGWHYHKIHAKNPLASCGKTTLWWTNIAMENHHFSWENPLFLWPFSIAMLVHQRLSSPHLCWVVPPPAQAAQEAAVVHRSGWCAPPPHGLPGTELSRWTSWNPDRNGEIPGVFCGSLIYIGSVKSTSLRLKSS